MDKFYNLIFNLTFMGTIDRNCMKTLLNEYASRWNSDGGLLQWLLHSRFCQEFEKTFEEARRPGEGFGEPAAQPDELVTQGKDRVVSPLRHRPATSQRGVSEEAAV